MTSADSAHRYRNIRMAILATGLAAGLGACTHTSQEQDITASVPNDYRLRHPIAVQEADRTVNIFVGNARGGLSASQRADVIGLASVWLREGTGAIVAEVPVHTTNARAAADSFREVRSLLTAAGVPPRGIVVREYRPADPRLFATIRLTYPRIAAVAGPCGVWPEDLGPSIHNKSYFDNKPYWNFRCATQRNLTAMVEDPADLVQPRTESPVYTARRTTVLDKYRKGEPTATQDPNASKAKISSVGQ